MCVVHRNFEIDSLTRSMECVIQEPNLSTPKRRASPSVNVVQEENYSLNRLSSVQKKKCDGEKHEESDEGKNPCVTTPINRTPMEILSTNDPSQILSVLHNNITMHKRIMGARSKCTPSTRWRHCTHHCLQILSARILTVMCHGPRVQQKIVLDGHLKTLVEALDPNHDPVSTL